MTDAFEESSSKQYHFETMIIFNSFITFSWKWSTFCHDFDKIAEHKKLLFIMQKNRFTFEFQLAKLLMYVMLQHKSWVDWRDEEQCILCVPDCFKHIFARSKTQ